MIGSNLQDAVSDATWRWELAGIVAKLFKLRVNADYRPEAIFAATEARLGIRLADKAYHLLPRRA